MKERFERILHDGLVANNYIGRKWRVEFGDIEAKGYQYMRVRFNIYRARCKKPVGTILAIVDTFRIHVDVSESGPFWMQWLSKYCTEIMEQNTEPVA